MVSESKGDQKQIESGDVYTDLIGLWDELTFELLITGDIQYAAEVVCTFPQELQLPVFNLLEKFIFAPRFNADLRQNPGLYKPHFALYEKLDQIFDEYATKADQPAKYNDQGQLGKTLSRRMSNLNHVFTDRQLDQIELIALRYVLTGQGLKLARLLSQVAQHPQGDIQMRSIFDGMTIFSHMLRAHLQAQADLSITEDVEIDLRYLFGKTHD